MVFKVLDDFFHNRIELFVKREEATCVDEPAYLSETLVAMVTSFAHTLHTAWTLHLTLAAVVGAGDCESTLYIVTIHILWITSNMVHTTI